MTTVLQEEPYVQVVSREFWSGKICFSCFQSLTKPLKCTRCSQSWYCSEKCQLDDWNSGQHKNECRVLRVIFQDPDLLEIVLSDRTIRGIARTMARKATEKSTDLRGAGWPVDMQIRQLPDLCSHLEFTMNDVEICHDIKPAWEIFEKAYGGNSKLFQAVMFDDFQHFAGLWMTNNMAIERARAFQDFEVLGAGLFLQASRFDHTCGQPDFTRFFRGAKHF